MTSTHHQLLGRSQRRAIARCYTGVGHQQYVRWKLAFDPVYAAMAGLPGNKSLPLLDIGCGLGLLGHYLEGMGRLSDYVGLDHDLRKIKAAQAAAHSAGLDRKMQFLQTDASCLPAVRGDVALLDVLHYLSASAQQALLDSAVQHLAPHGRLVIRNVLREPNWHFHITRLEEFFLCRSGWIPGGALHYPTAMELRAPLEHAGLEVHIEPLRGHTPFNSYLIVACRRD